MFNPDRLSLARRRAGRNKKDVAEALGVHQHTVLRYEAGETEPDEQGIRRLSHLLGFPEGFFHGPTLDEPSKESASFRSMSGMVARDRDAALAAGALAFAVDDWVQARFDLPSAELVDFTGEAPESAARALRQIWGLGEKPIRNMVHLLEAKGIRVFSLAENTRAIDAFSIWRQGVNVPYVFLNTLKTAEHNRMDAAHELAHLVLHRHGGPSGREAETEAQRFASSFLMPSADVLAEIPRVYGLQHIVMFKKRWGVSVAALNYRLHKLGITSVWQNRDLCIQISQQGFRQKEPEGTERPREMSVIWPKILDALRKEGISQLAIAEALHIPPVEIERLLFMLAPMLSVEGGRVAPAQRSRASLKLVP